MPEEPGDLLAQGHHGCAGQRGQVDDGVGFRLDGQGQSVGEDQPALGIGVEHLDGLAVAGGEHITGLGGRPPGMFSVSGTKAVIRIRHPRAAAASTAASTAAPPPMSVFMVSIPPAVLSDRPPESKVMPFADEGQMGNPAAHLDGVGRPVLDPHQPWRLCRTPGHPEQPAQALSNDPVLVPHLDGQLGPVGEPADEDVGELLGVSELGGSFTRSRARATDSASRAPRATPAASAVSPVSPSAPSAPSASRQLGPVDDGQCAQPARTSPVRKAS